MVIRRRRRPKLTSSKAKTARKPFAEDEHEKELPLHRFLDDYNHHMNHVDQADQLRCYTMNLRHTYKGWKALFQYVFNVILVNCYLLSYHTNVEPYRARFINQTRFRTVLIDSLINASKPPPPPPPPDSPPPAPPTLPQKRKRLIYTIPTMGEHVRVWRARKNECIQCRKEGQKEKGVKRIALAELGKKDQNKRHLLQYKRTRYGCKACDIALCKEGPCFSNFHSGLAV